MAKKKPIIAVGLDPGQTNFGWSIIAANSMQDYVLLEDGMLHTITSQATEVSTEFLLNIVDDVQSRILLSDATFLSIERYHPRGTTLVGVEYVNQMIGAIMCAVAGIPNVKTVTPTASTWKGIAYPKAEGWSHLDWFPEAKTIHSGDSACQVLSMLYYHKLIPWE